MTNLDSFYEAFINGFHIVLGVPLKPFSLGHLAYLQAINSPLLEPNGRAGLHDLEMAVLICSSETSEEMLRKLDVKSLPALSRLKHAYWHSRNKKRALKRHLERFRAYQEDYFTLPRFAQMNSTDEREEILPWILLIAASVIKGTGWGWKEVYSMPIGLLFQLSLSFDYLKTNKTNIISDKQAAIEEMLSKLGNNEESPKEQSP